MAFESLSEKLSSAFKKLRGKGRLTEADIKEAMREVRLALLEADVSYKVVKDFVKNVSERAVGQDVLDSLTPAQMVIKIVNEELCALMGSENVKLNISSQSPSVVMLVGLQGAGKTTNGAKLAGLMKKSGKRPLLVACDVYRPAAIKQLQVIGGQLDIPVFSMPQGTDAVTIAKSSLDFAAHRAADVVIIDTAGRLQINRELMEELKSIKAEVNPHEILLVVDAMTGQEAVNVAQSFNEDLSVDGVILTKMDGDARGGAALSIKAVTNCPIKFIGMGEKLEPLEPFYPDRMASRILGMGDILSLVERAQKQYDEKEARLLSKKIAKNQFNFDDFYNQIQQIKKMGNIKELASMIPGVGKAIKDVDIDNDSFKGIEAIILSMTKEERENPSLLDASRKNRIAKGSGRTMVEINRLLKQFTDMQKMMRAVQKGGMNPKMMKKRR